MKSDARKVIYAIFSISIAAALVLSSIVAVNNLTNVASALEEEQEPRFLDEVFLQIEEKLPGFAGYYYDEQQRVNVYLTQPDSSSLPAIKNALRNYIDVNELEKGIILKQTDFSWKTLDVWRDVLSQLALQENSGIQLLDVDERSQTLVIGLSELDGEIQHKIEAFLKLSNIPAQIVKFVGIGSTSLDLMGGEKIDEVPVALERSCTNGFIAILDGDTVSVTAGHCEIGVDTSGDQDYEYKGVFAGTEIANTNLEGPRYSDSLLFDPVISTAHGEIFKTSTSQYTITGKKLFPAQGEAICKMGKTTGETCGAVQTTGVNLFGEAAFPYGTLWMMSHADYASEDGDSGAPVYKKGDNDQVTLYGIHRGRTVVVQTEYATFSPMNNIQADQGTLDVVNGGLDVYAETCSGSYVNGLAAHLYDSNNNLIQSGFTPMYVYIHTTGNYVLKFNNYDPAGSLNYVFVKPEPVQPTPPVTGYTQAGWGGEVNLSLSSTGVHKVSGVYNDAGGTSCPTGSTGSIDVKSIRIDTGAQITGMYMQLTDLNNNQLGQGWTPHVFSNLTPASYKIWANDYCDSGTGENRVFNSWSDGTTTRDITVSVTGGQTSFVTARYDITTC